MSDNTSADTVATEAAEQTQTQATKTFTQDEVNAMMAKTKAQLEKKFSSRYEDLGDPEEIREIVTTYRKQQTEHEVKRGNFEKVLQDVVSKKDEVISKQAKMIEEFRVNTPILDAAARHRAVNPEQVKALIRSNVRLNEDGEPEVIDEKGQVQYDDSGRKVNVDTFVQRWLNQNPHFVQPTPSTTASRSNVGSNKLNSKVDFSKLNMNNPEDRALYKEWRKTQGLR